MNNTPMNQRVWNLRACKQCESQYKPTSMAQRFCSDECNIDNASKRFWESVNKDGPIPEGKPELGKCWLWMLPCEIGLGYGQIKVKGDRIRVHRFSYALHNGGHMAPGLNVLHLCNNPNCVNPAHLKMGTQKENIQQCVKDGRKSDRRGSNCPTAKLTDESVKQIWKDSKTMMRKDIASKHNMSRSVISNILNGKTWKNVDSTI